MGKTIVIAERDNIAAVMEAEKVTDFYIHRGDILLNDIYLAKVDNILPSIEAAFVDVGSDKMGFLHTEDVIGKGGLKDKLKPKQNLIVQVVKEPTGHKGPRVTTAISIPGRFLVLIPNEAGINISKKISTSKERARLKSILSLLKPVGVGVIVRTEAENQSEGDIQEDLELLLEKWNSIITASETVTAPNLLYRDQDLLYRVIREACSEDVTEIIVDTAFALQRTQNLVQNWHLNKDIKVSAYKGSESLLVSSGIYKEIKSALQTKINLPCGGYLYIQPTEALTVVDVNSGKFTSSATQEETIFKTNIEAVHEIARQLRLRNIGGMVIVDFIDMLSRANKLAVMEELEIALETDKAKPQVGQLSDLGLVELTRHRQGQTLAEIFTKKCPHCQGAGQIIEEIQFASSVSEGEYRAKAAKVKLPTHHFKNKPERPSKFNNNNNKQKQLTANPSLIAQVEVDTNVPDVKVEVDAKKLKEMITAPTDAPVKTADAVIAYDIVEQIKPQTQENSEKTDLNKNGVVPILTEITVSETEIADDETKQTAAPNQNYKKFNNRNNRNRRNNNRNFNNNNNRQQFNQNPQQQNQNVSQVEPVENIQPEIQKTETLKPVVETKIEIAEPKVDVKVENTEVLSEEKPVKKTTRTRRTTTTRTKKVEAENENKSE